MALKSNIAYVNLHIRITLALHHAPHQVILCHQILGLQQVDPQHPLQDDEVKWWKILYTGIKHFTTIKHIQVLLVNNLF